MRRPPRAKRPRGSRDPTTVAIVTGQQAGLFGGPLYTLYKALTAVKLAAQVSQEHQVPAVAVFWVESEDHDWDEVASCSVLDAELQRQRHHAAPAAGRRPDADRPAARSASEINAAIDQLAATLPPTGVHGRASSTICATPIARASRMSDAFARWMERLLGDLGLVVFECSDPRGEAAGERDFRARNDASRPDVGAGRPKRASGSPRAAITRRSTALAHGRRGAVPAERRAHAD